MFLRFSLVHNMKTKIKLLHLFTNLLDSQGSTPTQQATTSITTASATTPASTRSFTVPLPNTASAVPIAAKSKPPPLKIPPPYFNIPLVPSKSRIEKRTEIVRSNTPVSDSPHLMTGRRQPVHPTELNSKLSVHLDKERHINSNANQGFDMDLINALNPLINRSNYSNWKLIIPYGRCTQ